MITNEQLLPPPIAVPSRTRRRQKSCVVRAIACALVDAISIIDIQMTQSIVDVAKSVGTRGARPHRPQRGAVGGPSGRCGTFGIRPASKIE
jgi:hypothetical protein